MEEHRFVLPSNVFPSQQTSIDTARPRIPLTNSSGNAQYHTVATAHIYSDQKGLQPRPPPNFALPTLPSQPARDHPSRTALEARRSHIRNQRSHRTSRANPILESEHYCAYRSRQTKGNSDEPKWPDDLEDLFLEALCSLPAMGRRKFSLDGKPKGRNELISLYLWIGHQESLAPGEKPDQSKYRSRKQVSSHIQVLKGFMRGHPAFNRLFPGGKDPKNGFEDSFKNDPCLRALAQGRLPHRRSSQYNFLQDMDIKTTQLSSTPMRRRSPHNQIGSPCLREQLLRPALFKMFMTTLRPGVDFKDVLEDDAGDGKLSTKTHTYSDSVPRALGCSPLEMLPNWRARFPILAQLYSRNEIKCDIIHLESSLELRCGPLPERSELWGKFELLIPGFRNRQAVWRCTQSLYKPDDLYGPSSSDPRHENITSTPHPDRYEPGVGTYLRVSFPASPWAYALQRLSTMEAQFEEAKTTGGPVPTPITARQYIDQITMFQEIFCSAAPNQPFERKAIILWTFKKCRAGEQGVATWSYLDPSPPRSTCFSPHPGNTHVVSAAMTENFNAWAESSLPSVLHTLPSNAPNPFDALSQYDDLPTPLHCLSVGGGTPGMHSFSSYPAYGYQAGENMSFTSHQTQDSDATLVDIQNGHTPGGGVHAMDGFMANSMGLFDGSQTIWESQASSIDNFTAETGFDMNGYPAVTVPSNAPPANQIWDAAGAGEGKHEAWDGRDDGFGGYDPQLSQGQRRK